MMLPGCSIVLLFACTVLCPTPGHTQKTFKGQLVSGAYMKTRVFSSTLCQSLCWFSVSCMSCTWATRTGLCTLSIETRNTSPASFSASPHYMYSDGMHPRGMDAQHPCISRPCDVGEICIPVEAATSKLCLGAGMMSPSMTPVTTTVGTTIVGPTIGNTSTTSEPLSTASSTSTTSESLTTTSTTSQPLSTPSSSSATSTTAEHLSTTSSTSTTSESLSTTSTTAEPLSTTSSTSTTSESLTTTSTTAEPLSTTSSTSTTSESLTTTSTTAEPQSTTSSTAETSTTTSFTSTTSETTTTTSTTTTTTTTTTTAAQTNACVSDCAGLTGRHHSCKGCHMYTVCAVGMLTDMPCPGGTEWDNSLKTCVNAPSPTCP